MHLDFHKGNVIPARVEQCFDGTYWTAARVRRLASRWMRNSSSADLWTDTHTPPTPCSLLPEPLRSSSPRTHTPNNFEPQENIHFTWTFFLILWCITRYTCKRYTPVVLFSTALWRHYIDRGWRFEALLLLGWVEAVSYLTDWAPWNRFEFMRVDGGW